MPLGRSDYILIDLLKIIFHIRYHLEKYMQNIRYANFDDYELILKIDDSISKSKWKAWTDRQQALFIFNDSEFLGWLQYSYFIEK